MNEAHKNSAPKNDGKSLAIETIDSLVKNEIVGKEFGGYPFFEIDLKNIIRKEISWDPLASDFTATQLDHDAQEQFDASDYVGVKNPSYCINNGVCLLIEPTSEGGFTAYISAFPSEEQFQELRKSESSLMQFPTGRDYQRHVVDSFGLPMGAPYLNQPSMFEWRDMFVPVSQHGVTGEGVQTIMSAIIDRIIKNKKSQ